MTKYKRLKKQLEEFFSENKSCGDANKKLIEYAKGLSLELGKSTEPINRELVQELMDKHNKVCTRANKIHEIVWCQSPHELRAKSKQWGIENKKGNTEMNVSFGGRYDIYWLVCAVIRDIIDGTNSDEELVAFSELSLELGLWVHTTAGIAYICEPPTHQYSNAQGQLHNEKGAAIRYADGMGLFCLNGIVITNGDFFRRGRNDDSLPELIMKEKNADQRLELIKWYGIDRLGNNLGMSVVHALDDEYTLVDIVLEGSSCRFLKMVNQSSGEVHIEGVDNSCKTCEEAYKFRTGKKLEQRAFCA